MPIFLLLFFFCRVQRQFSNMCQCHWPAVRLTTEAVPAVMASTWEWISCFDSSILFCIHTFEAWREETKCKSVITVIPQRRHTGLKTQTPETNFIKWHFFHFQCMYVHCTVPCPAPEEAGCRLPRDLSGPSAQLAYWCWWFPSEPAVLNSAHTERPAGSLFTEFSFGYFKKKPCWVKTTACICEFYCLCMQEQWGETGDRRSIMSEEKEETDKSDTESHSAALTSGGMCPRCIWPIVICCWGDGMVPMLRHSVPMEPERITPGSATEPCSARPTRLNCCWRIVDLRARTQKGSKCSSDKKAACYFPQCLNVGYKTNIVWLLINIRVCWPWMSI